MVPIVLCTAYYVHTTITIQWIHVVLWGALSLGIKLVTFQSVHTQYIWDRCITPWLAVKILRHSPPSTYWQTCAIHSSAEINQNTSISNILKCITPGLWTALPWFMHFCSQVSAYKWKLIKTLFSAIFRAENSALEQWSFKQGYFEKLSKRALFKDLVYVLKL